MLILFFRAIIIYVLVFAVIRLSGKRQISDLQPFDLVITLLIADLAANPVSDNSMPLAYGVIPIFALFLVQQLVAYVSLKSERARAFVCGKPLVLISQGVVQEPVLLEARYTLNDLLEQLRIKDVFDINDVDYAILETNGTLSVLKKSEKGQPTRGDLGVLVAAGAPPAMLVLDGNVHKRALEGAGQTEEWLRQQVQRMGFDTPRDLLYASYSSRGTLRVQAKRKHGGAVKTLEAHQQ